MPNRDGPPFRRRERGFTLLEVLVAFAIAAIALSMLARASIDGVRAAHLAARYGEAVARARSHLAGLPTPPAAGDFQGDDGGGFHWHLRVTRGARTVTRQTVTLQLYDVAVAISWEDGDRKRVVTLATERVAVVNGV